VIEDLLRNIKIDEISLNSLTNTSSSGPWGEELNIKIRIHFLQELTPCYTIRPSLEILG
jgi:hypothetical protein